ncbi:LysE family translocator [Nocardia sp. NPDC052112]|uniref:LysE family translocator n=1 Tax=Nocardia sp. NPDC052112 TaxID=3155646 RepID=UPI00342C3F69
MPHWIDVLPQFLLACLILAALPGPATALFLQRAVRDGRGAGLAAVAGNEIGVFGWTLAGGAGLSVLLVANRFMNTAVHVIGALVLIWLGVQAWRGARQDDDSGSTALTRPAGCHPRATELLPSGRSPGSAFRASLISIAANPKAAVFGLTILPQFLPSSGPVLPTVLILAGIQLVIDTAWCIGIVLAADRAGTWLRRTGIRQRVERALGAILVALGLGLAADAR